MIEDIQAFPTPVRRIKNFLSIEECQNILAHSSQLPFIKHPSFIGEVISTHDTHRDVFELFPNADNLKERLSEQINWFTEELGIEEVRLTNSWMNKQYENTFLQPHLHPMSVISGALYVNVDENSSKISFLNPNPFFSLMAVQRSTKYFGAQMVLQPELGELILFPSWLRHCGGSEYNQTYERTVISFNTEYAGSV